MSYTIPWNLESQSIKHILNHNLYGKNQRTALEISLPNTQIVTSSNELYLKTPLQLQNIETSWENLNKLLKLLLEDSVLGAGLVFSPICGSTANFNDTVYEKLCIRWYLVAATMPMFRISSDKPRRDPESLKSQYAKFAVVDAIKKRDKLLLYFNNILIEEEPIIRPMFYNFHDDINTIPLYEQYMIGEALLVAHPMKQNLQNIKVYLPQSKKIWYEFWGGLKINTTGWNTINIIDKDWVMFIAEGYIVPLKLVSY